LFHYEVRLSGEGGQGLITAGIILAEAAILDGYNVVQSQSYGPESRGGASRAEVIIGDGPIDYPKVRQADLLLAMAQPAWDKYGAQVKEDAIIIVDSGLVKVGTVPGAVQKGRLVALPITALTREKIGRDLATNIVALGLVVGLSGFLREESVRRAVLRRVPRGTEEMNRRALELGLNLAEENRAHLADQRQLA